MYSNVVEEEERTTSWSLLHRIAGAFRSSGTNQGSAAVPARASRNPDWILFVQLSVPVRHRTRNNVATEDLCAASILDEAVFNLRNVLWTSQSGRQATHTIT
jgi:hypothetical protein